MKPVNTVIPLLFSLAVATAQAEMLELDAEQLQEVKLSEGYLPDAVLTDRYALSSIKTSEAVENAQVKFVSNSAENVIPRPFVNPSPIVLQDGTEIFLTLDEIYRLPDLAVGDVLRAIRGENDFLPSVTQAVSPEQIRELRRVALPQGTRLQF